MQQSQPLLSPNKDAHRSNVTGTQKSSRAVQHRSCIWKRRRHSKGCDAAPSDKFAGPTPHFNARARSVRCGSADRSRRQPDCVHRVGFPAPRMAHGPYLAHPGWSCSTRHRPYVSGLNVTATFPGDALPHFRRLPNDGSFPRIRTVTGASQPTGKPR